MVLIKGTQHFDLGHPTLQIYLGFVSAKGRGEGESVFSPAACKVKLVHMTKYMDCHIIAIIPRVDLVRGQVLRLLPRTKSCHMEPCHDSCSGGQPHEAWAPACLALEGTCGPVF